MLKVDDTGFTCNTLINPMFLGKEMNADYHKDRIKYNLNFILSDSEGVVIWSIP